MCRHCIHYVAHLTTGLLSKASFPDSANYSFHFLSSSIHRHLTLHSFTWILPQHQHDSVRSNVEEASSNGKQQWWTVSAIVYETFVGADLFVCYR